MHRAPKIDRPSQFGSIAWRVSPRGNDQTRVGRLCACPFGKVQRAWTRVVATAGQLEGKADFGLTAIMVRS